MAVGASFAKRSVEDNERAIGSGLRLMAFDAGYFGMCSVERELRITVVYKSEAFPALRGMATRAIGVRLPFFQELVLMRVLVAGETLDVNRFHPQHGIRRADLLDHVTGETRFLLMLADQSEAAELVVEGGAVPRFGVMTVFTAALRNPPIELSLVRVFVAALTGKVGEIETRVACAFLFNGRMTNEAGNGEVASR